MANRTPNPETARAEFEVAATLAAIESLQGTLTMARALVLAGRSVDLAGLDREAARLCAAVACLPGDSGQALLGSLAGLAQEIDLLSRCLAEP
ncbi:hypothetical protein [Sediminicoccus sp. KRV36]|uniref:hypothetical protein n=1 Tax=Sediminicoccus sp. KRV36 TaxID=3133721 RepID=UPI00200CE846|nr:hypothetical protein [Sediminicoccus rosea]UPY38718.1 hypothetical protein LHU95_08485 [Sediminicoccus rosea]